MLVLGKPVSSGRVFIAGEFWNLTKRDDPKNEAQEQNSLREWRGALRYLRWEELKW